MIRYTAHARTTIAERGLASDWVERAIEHPDWTEPDVGNPALTRSFKGIVEAENRVLRVVHRPDGADILVITAFLDRGAKR